MRAKSELRSAQQRTITRLYVDEALAYDPETGVLTWRERPLHHFKHALAQRCWNARFAGSPAGNIGVQGYLCVGLNGILKSAHRVIWFLVHGEEPETIDHINGQRADNRLVNLRAVTKRENNRNQRRHANNTSGHPGVSLRRGKWSARIDLTLGQYATKEEAIAARRAAEQRLGYHPNHGREA